MDVSIDPAPPTSGPLRDLIAGPVRVGVTAVVVFVVAFGVWSVSAPLAGGAVAPGLVSPDGHRRTVQHLEGGIVAAIHVRDGDVVEAGDPLVTLESERFRADRDILRHRHATVLATRARLEAEASGASELALPAQLTAILADASPERRIPLQEWVDEEARVFAVRRDVHASRRGVLEARMEQLRDQVDGLTAQASSASTQLTLIGDELASKEDLWEKRLVARSEILRLQRMTASIEGDRAQTLSDIARAKERMGETRLELLALDASRAAEVAAELSRVRAELASIAEELAASEDVVQRMVVKAPVSGSVVGLRVHTRGGVVAPGATILSVVPRDEALLIDTRVSPRDIDVVVPGLRAQVQLSAYSGRILHRIDGTVETVSADRLEDEATGAPYFLARVRIDDDALLKQDVDVSLMVGMPADVLIVTSERSVLAYLLEPLFGLLFSALREV